MLSISKKKLIQKLRQKKYRVEYQMFVAETPKVVDQFLSFGMECLEIYCLRDWKSENELKKIIQHHIISTKELDFISSLKNPNQVLAIFRMPRFFIERDTLKDQHFLVLDDIRDPGNLGTIIRTANWFGIDHIICSDSSVDCFNPKVVQASMGALGQTSIYYEDLNSFLSKLDQKIKVYGALMEGDSLYEQEFSSQSCIIIGNESHGISSELLKFITHPITIPSIKNKHVESLNAAVATAVICSELTRM